MQRSARNESRHIVRERWRNGWQPKPLYRPIWPAKDFDAGTKTPSRPKRINNRSPTTDNIQKNILRPLTTNSRTKIVRGSKKVGDRSLRDHANTLAVCNCYTYANVHSTHSIPRKSFDMYCCYPSETCRQPVREPINDQENILPTSLVGKRFSMQLQKHQADQNA